MMGADVALVAIESFGGKYEDEAFLAGFHAGTVNMGLTSGSLPNEFLMPLYENSIEQIDLIAMKHGYVTEIMESFGGWSLVKFNQGSNIELEELL